MTELPEVRFPDRLQSGDAVALVAPGGAVEAQRVEAAVELLESRGLRVRVRDDIATAHRYLAGEDGRRSRELLDALAAPEVRAVFLARGGYGTQRILDRLDPRQVGSPRAVAGFSDNTALLNALRTRCGWAVLHGPHPDPASPGDLDAVLGCLGLFGDPARPAFLELEVLNPGPGDPVHREVAGGCIAILSSSIGTPYAFSAHGRIVFLEDVAEPVYRLDRMLHQLRASGALDDAAAIVFGRPESFLAAGENARDLAGLLREFAQGSPCPVLAGLPCGHTRPNLPLPFGPKALLDPRRGTLAFSEALAR